MARDDPEVQDLEEGRSQEFHHSQRRQGDSRRRDLQAWPSRRDPAHGRLGIGDRTCRICCLLLTLGGQREATDAAEGSGFRDDRR